MTTKEYGHGTLADGVRILARQEVAKAIDRVLDNMDSYKRNSYSALDALLNLKMELERGIDGSSSLV